MTEHYRLNRIIESLEREYREIFARRESVPKEAQGWLVWQGFLQGLEKALNIAKYWRGRRETGGSQQEGSK